MKKKALAMLLVLCMVLSMLPVSVFAAQPQPVTKTAPMKLDELPREVPAISTQAKYTVSLSGGSHGTTELLVSSPAASGSEVYFLADPDDGYLAYIYCAGVDPEDIVYVGADVYGFIMPAGKVTLEVEFVAAEGEEHRIYLYGADGGGQCQLSRTSAKEHESVLLAVLPEHDYDFEPTELVWAFGADIYYLFEQDGIHYYELFMGAEDVQIILCYNVRGAHKITKDFWGGKLELESDYAVTNKEVVFSVAPPDDYIMDEVQVITKKGNIPLELTYLGEDQGSHTYSFIMPPCDVKVKLHCHAETWNITVNHNSGGVAYADRTSSPKSLGIRVTCTPDEGYRVAGVTGNVTITNKGNNLYSFVMPEHDVTIDVTFKPIYNPVTVTVETGLGGTAAVDVETAKAGDTITLTCAPEEGYRVAQIIGADGLVDNGDGTYSFVMPDEPVDLKVLFLRNENPFLDINETQFFYDSVLWAFENGITGGVDATHFGPAGVCNRAQVVTFLYKAHGSAEPTLTENPFTDVPDGSWYAAPVLWAFENGITGGTDATHFNPGGQCLRAFAVTFLHKADQIPTVYPVNAQFDAEMGTVTLSHTKAAAGEAVTVTAVPFRGCRLKELYCESGADLRPLFGADGYSFYMPDRNETVHAVFEKVVAYNVPPTDPDGQLYVLDLNDMCFHYPDCVEIEQIAPWNYYECTCLRESLIDHDYHPCDTCQS